MLGSCWCLCCLEMQFSLSYPPTSRFARVGGTSTGTTPQYPSCHWVAKPETSISRIACHRKYQPSATERYRSLHQHQLVGHLLRTPCPRLVSEMKAVNYFVLRGGRFPNLLHLCPAVRPS